MARNFARIERIERDVDAADAAVAQFAGEARQLRAVGGQRQFIERAAAEMARQRAHQRHHVAPDQRLAAGQAHLAHALGDEGRAQPVEFFQRQQIGLRQEGHVLGHAIEAAQVAAIGDRHAQIADGPAERIGHRPEQRSGELNEDPFIQACLVMRAHVRRSARQPSASHNLGTLQRRATIRQACAACGRAACGSAAVGAAAARRADRAAARRRRRGGLRRLRLLRPHRLACGFGGGPAGCSSANTGLGSMMVVAGVVKSPGLRITCTGTVAGWNLCSVKVTEKPASGAGTATEQGVLQPGPSEVVASAPGGAEFELHLHRRRRRLEGIAAKTRSSRPGSLRQRQSR